MARLILMRHAKSSWADPGQRDFDRPLNGRGLKAAPQMGERLRALGLVPDRILVSPARRASETLDGVLSRLGEGADIAFVADLYEVHDTGYLGVIAREGRGAGTLMVVGHNPATHITALELAAEGGADRAGIMAVKFPTAAFAVIGFAHADWQALRPGTGRLECFETPQR